MEAIFKIKDLTLNEEEAKQVYDFLKKFFDKQVVYNNWLSPAIQTQYPTYPTYPTSPFWCTLSSGTNEVILK